MIVFVQSYPKFESIPERVVGNAPLLQLELDLSTDKPVFSTKATNLNCTSKVPVTFKFLVTFKCGSTTEKLMTRIICFYYCYILTLSDPSA